MSNKINTDNKLPTDTEAYYETLASQEEIYLEERAERIRAIVTSEAPSPSRSDADSGADELELAAEELITGDSDDAPLSDEALEILRVTLGSQVPRRR